MYIFIKVIFWKSTYKWKSKGNVIYESQDLLTNFSKTELFIQRLNPKLRDHGSYQKQDF